MSLDETSVLHQYALLLEQLNLDTLERLEPLLAENVRFSDPFNEVIGREAFLGLMRELFEQANEVCFETLDAQQNGQIGYLYWRFSFKSRLAGSFSTLGCSRIVFDADHRVIQHQDFWDASALMQQFPLLGRVIKGIRAKAAYSAS